MTDQDRLILEASWEVCNKVGGIFTVVSSKAALMKEKYGDKYFLIGPYFADKLRGVFEESVTPPFLKPTFAVLENEGIHCVFGNWQVKGNPSVILVDFSKFTTQTNDIKTKLWEWYGIDSLGTEYHDFDEPVVWSWAVGRLAEELAKNAPGKTVLHCHEWLAAAALLYTRHQDVKAGTIFTTHATTLGRTIASSHRPLYELLSSINPDEEISHQPDGTRAKHLLEKCAATTSHVFSTVSEITGLESTALLKKSPDILLYNGLDLDKFPTFEETSLKHKMFKGKIFEFLEFYFFPYYSFDLEHTLIYFLCARNEFHDKGIDIYVQALGELDKQLRAEKSPRTVIAFLFVPGAARETRAEIVESRTFFNDIKNTIEETTTDLRRKTTNALLSQREITAQTLFDEATWAELKKKLIQFKRKSQNPPLCTHYLYDEDQNTILHAFRAQGLLNTSENRVKVINYPTYLNGADGLLDTNYYESMMGGHLGVFPSYYEPWGYTPQEAASLGVPSVTTDLAGFGRFMLTKTAPAVNPGIWVIKRQGKSNEDAAKELTKIMYNFAHFNQHDRVANKIAAKSSVQDASWSFFAQRYVAAHDLALQRVNRI